MSLVSAHKTSVLEIEYKVWIVPGKQYLAQSSQTSANVYMAINGELGRTEKIQLGKGCNEFSFKVNFIAIRLFFHGKLFNFCNSILNLLIYSLYYTKTCSELSGSVFASLRSDSTVFNLTSP